MLDIKQRNICNKNKGIACKIWEEKIESCPIRRIRSLYIIVRIYEGCNIK
jgi:hypothetical protein